MPDQATWRVNNRWSSSVWGERITGAEPWVLFTGTSQLHLFIKGKDVYTGLDSLESMKVTKGWFWATIRLNSENDGVLVLGGISNSQCALLEKELSRALRLYRLEQEINRAIDSFDELLSPIKKWYRSTSRVCTKCHNEHRWITEEMIQEFLQKRPTEREKNGFRLVEILNEPRIQKHLSQQSAETQSSVKLWLSDLRATIENLNRKHLLNEMEQCRGFFNQVEKSPLSDEQIEAVVCFDNRVQVVAAAGSGKTSTMIAKAGYALKRNLVQPEKILLLAFNADAAKELQLRTQERLAPLGLAADTIVAKTFHAFGLDVIGRATGKRPSLARWVEQGRDIEHMSEIVEGLKTRSKAFRVRWALFRMVFGRDVPRFGKDEIDPEDWDRPTGKRGFRTLQGEVVKSQSERVIADWLFFHGVEYRYEMPYPHDTADATHRQYNPDFYYPEADLYHEHFALDREGKPPPEFPGYMEGVRWKRNLHREKGTTLIETTSADLWSGQAFDILEENLTKRGIKLNPDPDRSIPEGKLIEDKALVRLFRSFLTHAKSNRLSDEDLRRSLGTELFDSFTYRHSFFLDLFSSIREEWERHLKDHNAIDFDDMLNLAADHLDAGDWQPPYELVLVDEFQDASQARARLARALVNKPGRHLFAVGDDWQSINRFAGSDISVMTGFNDWFGPGPTLRLQRTFRCPQEICDISSRFILKNPRQIDKRVESAATPYKPAIEAFQVNDDAHIRTAIKTYLEQLYKGLQEGHIAKEKHRKIKIFVLGRYRHENELVPSNLPMDIKREIELSFSTVHGSKGLEADYVIIPRLITGLYGFPSNIEDDPVMQLAMPFSDDIEHSEERRLFYVALTRARRSVALFTLQGRLSPFVTELLKDHKLELRDIIGNNPVHAQICNKCGKGTMVTRTSRYGKFYACSRFPKCDNKYDSRKSNNRRHRRRH